MFSSICKDINHENVHQSISFWIRNFAVALRQAIILKLFTAADPQHIIIGDLFTAADQRQQINCKFLFPQVHGSQ